jgi:ADP-ribose pyrophosphatase YjhB (NUDIX family)/UTP-glucose-1-phosphate uridylyltransferase
LIRFLSILKSPFSVPLPLSGIDVAILVGGLGMRLRGVVDNLPKPLAPVFGRPFLFYLLDMLALRGARSVTLCSGYMADFVQEKTGSEWMGMPIHHSVESEPMGTAGALALAREFLQSDRVLVMNGDTWFEPDFKSFAETSVDSEVCIAATEVPNASRYGTLDWNSLGRLNFFKEKSGSPVPGKINAGVYFVSQNLLESLRLEPCSLERKVLPALTNERRVKVFSTDAPFLDMGVPVDYAFAAEFFRRLEILPHSMFPDFPDMKEAAVKLGTCILIFDKLGRILMERRSDCGWWGLPGGRLDAGETITDSALREVAEETGLKVEIKDFLGIFSNPRRRTVRYLDNGDLRQLVDVVVLAVPLHGKLTSSSESLDLRWISPIELPLNTVPPVVEILRSACGQTSVTLLR